MKSDPSGCREIVLRRTSVRPPYQFRNRGSLVHELLQRLGGDLVGGRGSAEVMRRVRRFDHFNGDNAPHGEHDFLSFNIAGQTFFAKIDYYDKTPGAASFGMAKEK